MSNVSTRPFGDRQIVACAVQHAGSAPARVKRWPIGVAPADGMRRTHSSLLTTIFGRSSRPTCPTSGVRCRSPVTWTSVTSASTYILPPIIGKVARYGRVCVVESSAKRRRPTQVNRSQCYAGSGSALKGAWRINGRLRRGRRAIVDMADAMAAAVGPWAISAAPRKGVPGRSIRWTSIFRGTCEKRMIG
jgi:hypothetical protein